MANVEKAFRTLKSLSKLRPIHHHLEDRVRAHVFMCLLAYYVQRHMRQKPDSILFEDNDQEATEALRQSVVAPAQRSNQKDR